MKRSSLLLIAVLGALATPVAAEPFVAEHTQPHSTTAEIDAQVRANKEADRASYWAVVRAGGCDADFIPPAIASHCWSATVGSGTPNPQGPIGASMGGSD